MLDSDCQVIRCTWQNISDVNGAYNIMRKAVSNSIKEDEIEGLVINPSIIKIEK